MGQAGPKGQPNPNNPANPNKGRSMVPANHKLKYTEQDMINVLKQAEGFARKKFLAEIGVTDLNTGRTPSSRWFDENGKDEFAELVNMERAALVLGDYTDDELANLVFMNGDMDREEDTRQMIAAHKLGQRYIPKIGVLTAGKERMRWLSRHLEQSLNQNRQLRNAAWDFLMEEHGNRGEDAIREMANQLLLPKEFVDGKFNKMKENSNE